MSELRKDPLQGKETAIVSYTCLEHIRAVYELDPELAGHLAISYFEYIFTGRYSFEDNAMIKMNMIDLMRFSDVNKKKYEDVLALKKDDEIIKKELVKIADGLKRQLSKDVIAASLNKPCGMSTLYDRIKTIKTKYPELLEEIPENSGEEPEKVESKIEYTYDFKF